MATSRNRKTSQRRAKSPSDLPSASADPAWDQLSAKHPGDARLKVEAIYSLPRGLIDAIVRRVPRLLGAADVKFERDLSEATACGFFRGTRFHYPPLTPRRATPAPKDELDRKTRESTQRIQQMLVDDMRSRGESEENIRRFFEFETVQNTAVEERRWSYAGWLATSGDFRRERDLLRSSAEKCGEQSQPPSLPLTLTGYSDPTDNNDLAQAFLRRWGLESLATWELPVPMRPELASPSLYSLTDIGDAGVTLFIPWYLVRDRNISLHDLVDRQRRLHLPAPLQGWLKPKPKNWGYKRFAELLLLYIYLELGLKRRYPARINRNRAKLDSAFADWFAEEEGNCDQTRDDSVRKIRYKLTAMLRDI